MPCGLASYGIPCAIMLAMITLQLVIRHSSEGRVVEVNPPHITAMHTAQGGDHKKLVTGGCAARSIPATANLSARFETCETVDNLIEQAEISR
jgi:hypothetical protein